MRPPVLSRYLYIAFAFAGLVAVFLPIALTQWLTPTTRSFTLEQANRLLAMDDRSADSIAEAAKAMELPEGEDVEAELASFVGTVRTELLLLLEAGVYESLQILLGAIAAGILLWTFIREPEEIDFGAFVTPRNIFVLLLSLILLVALGVESGWGLRLFSAPEAEATTTGTYIEMSWMYSMIVYLGLLPLIVVVVPPLAKLVDRFHVPIAGWPIGVLTLALFVPSIAASIGNEVTELLFAIMLVALALETQWIARHGRPDTKSEPLSLRPAILSRPVYVAIAVVGVIAILVPLFLPSWLAPGSSESILDHANRMLSREHVEVKSIEEAAAEMDVPEGEDAETTLAAHLGRVRSQRILFSEDGIYETLQAVLCGAAAIILLWTFFRHRSEINLRVFTTKRNVFLLLLALTILVMLGEEVSWGQRLFRFDTPEWLTQRNFQGEFTFHNMRTFQAAEEGNSLEVGWLWIMVGYLGVLPLATAISRPLGAWIDKYRFPVADWPLGVITLGLFTLNVLLFRTSEVTELIIDILLIVLAIEIYVKASFDVPPVEHQRLAFGVGIWVALWCLTLPFQAGEDELPSVRSTDLYKAAMRSVNQGDEEQAIETLEESLAIWPNNVRAHHSLAQLLVEQNETEQAIEHLNEALRIEPRFIPSLLTLATVLSEQNDWASAIDIFRRVIAAEPDFQRLLSRRADLLQATNNVAWIMATQPDESLRDGFGSVELSQQICEATDFDNPSYLDTLAAGWAEMGKFEKAIEVAKQAIDIALEADDIGLAGHIQGRMNRYEDGEPYRDESLQ